MLPLETLATSSSAAVAWLAAIWHRQTQQSSNSIHHSNNCNSFGKQNAHTLSCIHSSYSTITKWVAVASSSCARTLGKVPQFILHLYFFSFFLIFFFKWRSFCAHQFPLFSQDQSTVAKRAETTVAKCPWQVAHEFVSPTGSHTMYGWYRLPNPTPWVKCACKFICNLPPAPLTEWLGSFTCHCGNTSVEQTLNKSQRGQLTLEKKILPLLLLGTEPMTFWSQGRPSTNWAIPTNWALP